MCVGRIYSRAVFEWPLDGFDSDAVLTVEVSSAQTGPQTETHLLKTTH